MDALHDDLRTAWHRFVDELAPLRPALHGYCRRLTGDVWDAEDLLQDTLLRAFGQWTRARRAGLRPPPRSSTASSSATRRATSTASSRCCSRASAENVGNSYHLGLDPAAGMPRFLRAVVHGHPEWPADCQRESRRIERRDFEREPLLRLFATRNGREALEAVLRVEERDGRIARIRAYGFCPETMRAVGEALGVRVRTGIYRAPAATRAG